MATQPQITDDLVATLQALVDAIDFEGPVGAVKFNPGTPWELDALRDARAVLVRAAQVAA